MSIHTYILAVLWSNYSCCVSILKRQMTSERHDMDLIFFYLGSGFFFRQKIVLVFKFSGNLYLLRNCIPFFGLVTYHKSEQEKVFLFPNELGQQNYCWDLTVCRCSKLDGSTSSILYCHMGQSPVWHGDTCMWTCTCNTRTVLFFS